MYYLNSFKPLVYFKQGREAIEKYNLPPFIDASCRREPDFQNPLPSISALCRGAGFAPRLKEGDKVIYMTVKGNYLDESIRHWRLVAILEVVKRFDSHKEAAQSYLNSELPIPNNCMVSGNDHMPYEMTGGMSAERLGGATNDTELVRKWNLSYLARSKKYKTFLSCRTEFLELYNPPILTDELMLEIFGRTPPTLTPPPILEKQFTSIANITKY